MYVCLFGDVRLSTRAVVLESRTLLRKFREGRMVLGFLVAFSAVVTALQPIVQLASSAAAWVLTGLGIVAALIAVVSVLLEQVVKRMERQGMLSLQDYDKV